MKKTLSLVLASAMVITMFAACSKDEGTTATPTPSPAATATVAAADPTEEPAADQPDEPAADPTDEPAAEPAIDESLFLVADFDNESDGVVIKKSQSVTTAPAFTNMYFSAMGSAETSLSEGNGVDGSNCMLVSGRSDAWNGASLKVAPELFGKALRVSYDAYCVSEESADVVMSLTSTFKVMVDGAEAAQYPQYNRADATIKTNEWTHIEGLIYIPSDILVDENGNSTCSVYFEYAGCTNDYMLDNINITIEDGIGDYSAFLQKMDEIAATKETEE